MLAFVSLPPQPGPIATETEGEEGAKTTEGNPTHTSPQSPHRGVPLTSGKVPPPVPAEENLGGTGRVPPHHHTPQTRLARPGPAACSPTPGGSSPPSAPRGSAASPDKMVALPRGRAVRCCPRAMRRPPPLPHSPQRPARRTRWPLPPLNSSPGRVGQRLSPPGTGVDGRQRGGGAGEGLPFVGASLLSPAPVRVPGGGG